MIKANGILYQATQTLPERSIVESNVAAKVTFVQAVDS